MHHATLACGATLAVEPIENVASAAVTWLLPVGSASDPDDGDGHAALLSELIFRGAGGLDARQHSDALDRLGIQRSSGVTSHHLRLSATLLGRRIHDALDLLAMMVRRPALEATSLDPVRNLAIQSLESLEDDPQHRVMLDAVTAHRAAPWNRHGYGDPEVLRTTDIDTLRAAWARRCRPLGTIVAVAGAVDPLRVQARLDELLDGWEGAAEAPPPPGPGLGARHHAQRDTAQVHIGLVADAPAERERDAALERVAIAVLSGGTSARLFTEVRQKRSLCYSVGASYRAGRDGGVVRLYAGTTPERAQQTLDTSLEVIEGLRDGAAAAERDRALIGLRSDLVMQGESTGARAAAIAADCFRLGRPRSLEERAAALDAVDLEALNGYLRRRRFGPFTIASIGPVALHRRAAAAARI